MFIHRQLGEQQIPLINENEMTVDVHNTHESQTVVPSNMLHSSILQNILEEVNKYIKIATTNRQVSRCEKPERDNVRHGGGELLR